MATAARTILLVVMLLVTAVPPVLTLLVQKDPIGRAWLASPPLGNVVFPLQPAWTVAGWTSGDFQRRTDRWFADVVEPRGYAIPITNQLFYVAFASRTCTTGRS